MTQPLDPEMQAPVEEPVASPDVEPAAEAPTFEAPAQEAAPEPAPTFEAPTEAPTQPQPTFEAPTEAPAAPQPTFAAPAPEQPAYAQPAPGQAPFGATPPPPPYGAPQGQPAYGAPGGDQLFQGQQYNAPVGTQKSKIVAGILGILLGALGIHNFYLGYMKKAIIQLLITVVSVGMLSWVSGIWGLVEGILILISKPGETWHRDATGIELSD